MSITDPIEAAYYERSGKWYIKQGKETYYDPLTREWVLFDTKKQAELFISIMEKTPALGWKVGE